MLDERHTEFSVQDVGADSRTYGFLTAQRRALDVGR